MMKILVTTLSLITLSFAAPPVSSLSLFIMISLLSIPLLFTPLLSPSLVTPLFLVDSLSSPLISLTLWLSALMIMASQAILSPNHRSSILFTSLVTLLSSTLILAFSFSKFILFYIFFELSLPPTLLLILMWGYQPERLQAGTYLMLYTITASLPLLIALFLLKLSSGHSLMWMKSFILPSSIPLILWWVMTTFAFLVKLPLYITHLWLPKAHVEAPTAGSMILAGILLKLGSYGLLRLSAAFPSLNLQVCPMYTAVALWGGVMTSMVCLRQTDLKALIAYSSIGHMSLIVAGLLTASSWGNEGGLAMSLSHGLCSSALFALAGLLYNFTHTRSLFLMKGLLTIAPSMSLWWFIFSISNMAAPPSLNLPSEILLISATIMSASPSIIPLMIISFLTAAYSLMLYTYSSHGAPSPTMPFMPSFPHYAHHTLFLHIFPLLVIILSPNIALLWL